jgi:hypothetical protein
MTYLRRCPHTLSGGGALSHGAMGAHGFGHSTLKCYRGGEDLSVEQERLQQDGAVWRHRGPYYVSERAWGTGREDYRALST